ncbi:MAG: hypothetical protein IAE82_09685 [Opitutaceae bacterium]|nr:hypothetical protein [Opitutaceae bacterium]
MEGYLAFYSRPAEETISIPMESLQFLDDLLVAYVWLQHQGFAIDPVFSYLAMLKYQRSVYGKPQSIGPPLAALSVPVEVLSDPAIDAAVDKLFGSAICWILFHETGHIVLKHGPQSNDENLLSQVQELAADCFANEKMLKIGAVPSGMIPFFSFQLVIDDNRFDFPDAESWERHVLTGRTHPLSGERLRNIAAYVMANAAGFVREEREFKPGQIVLMGLQIERLGLLVDDSMVHQTLHLMGQVGTAADLRPGNISEFWRRIAAAAK